MVKNNTGQIYASISTHHFQRYTSYNIHIERNHSHHGVISPARRSRKGSVQAKILDTKEYSPDPWLWRAMPALEPAAKVAITGVQLYIYIKLYKHIKIEICKHIQLHSNLVRVYEDSEKNGFGIHQYQIFWGDSMKIIQWFSYLRYYKDSLWM